MGGERSSTTRMRLAGKICCLCGRHLDAMLWQPPGERVCEACEAKRSPSPKLYRRVPSLDAGDPRGYCRKSYCDRHRPRDRQGCEDARQLGSGEFQFFLREVERTPFCMDAKAERPERERPADLFKLFGKHIDHHEEHRKTGEEHVFILQ
jgi:hypothetical protein